MRRHETDIYVLLFYLLSGYAFRPLLHVGLAMTYWLTVYSGPLCVGLQTARRSEGSSLRSYDWYRRRWALAMARKALWN